MWRYGYWPLDWRGGRLQELRKKGSTRISENIRGLLISDHPGKAAAVVYESVDTQYHAYLPPSTMRRSEEE